MWLTPIYTGSSKDFSPTKNCLDQKYGIDFCCKMTDGESTDGAYRKFLWANHGWSDT